MIVGDMYVYIAGEMSSYVGVVVSDPWLHSQFTQVELRTLKSKVNQSTIYNLQSTSFLSFDVVFILFQKKKLSFSLLV